MNISKLEKNEHGFVVFNFETNLKKHEALFPSSPINPYNFKIFLCKPWRLKGFSQKEINKQCRVDGMLEDGNHISHYLLPILNTF